MRRLAISRDGRRRVPCTGPHGYGSGRRWTWMPRANRPREGRPDVHARARMRPRASTPNRRRPDVNSAATAEKAGPRCGCACPAVGSPARTTHRISTPEPTTRRPTIPSPPGCPAAHARCGVTSIDVRSEPDRHEVHAPDSRSRRLDLSSSASAAVRPTHAAPSTLLPGSSSL